MRAEAIVFNLQDDIVKKQQLLRTESAVLLNIAI
jgi:hypothetical protein